MKENYDRIYMALLIPIFSAAHMMLVFALPMIFNIVEQHLAFSSPYHVITLFTIYSYSVMTLPIFMPIQAAPDGAFTRRGVGWTQ